MVCAHKPGPPKEPKILAQYPKIESIGSIGSIILAILEVQENGKHNFWNLARLVWERAKKDANVAIFWRSSNVPSVWSTLLLPLS